MSVRLRFNWGTGIGLTYALFVAGTVGFVVFALGQPVELVSADYYSRSLTYDERLDAVRRADALGDAFQVTPAPDGHAVIITLPREQALASAAVGMLTFYRPSSVAADRVVPLAMDAHGEQRLSLDGLASGRWILKMDWQTQGRRYYRERAVQVP
jgi:nitrogen fixation protein FixH